MATIKQIDANRRNAQHSTGPRTEEGKQAASLNALKTGIYAESEVIPGERPEAFAALAAEYHAHHRPATPEARDLVDSLIRNAWLLRRLAAAEAAAFNCDCEGCRQTYEGCTDLQIVSHRVVRNVKRLDLLQRRINSTERNYHRSLKALQTLPASGPGPQPLDPEPISGNLASFPQPTPEPPQTLQQQPGPLPDPEAYAAPEKGAPSSASCISSASPAPANPEGILAREAPPTLS
jgi:hypothetical protein